VFYFSATARGYHYCGIIIFVGLLVYIFSADHYHSVKVISFFILLCRWSVPEAESSIFSNRKRQATKPTYSWHQQQTTNSTDRFEGRRREIFRRYSRVSATVCVTSLQRHSFFFSAEIPSTADSKVC